jgi:hypothetical protein
MRALAFATFLRCSLLFLLFQPCFALAQVPREAPVREVELCEILSDPAPFDGQMVRFRGRLTMEFETRVVDDSACGPHLRHTGIWWSYGGEPVITTFPGDAKRIDAVTSPIVKDAQFHEFETRAHSHRARRPDGKECNSYLECKYYDVVTTFTGRFWARNMAPRRNRTGPFGHMGCCHLFVVEHISDVAFQRTPVPDDNQQFSCTTTTWQSEYTQRQVSNLEGRAAANRQFLADQMLAHGDGSLVEAMDPNPWHYLGMTGSIVWSSPDLLTTYTVLEFPHVLHRVKTKKQQSIPPPVSLTMNVSRESCLPVVN